MVSYEEVLVEMNNNISATDYSNGISTGVNDCKSLKQNTPPVRFVKRALWLRRITAEPLLIFVSNYMRSVHVIGFRIASLAVDFLHFLFGFLYCMRHSEHSALSK